MQPTLAPAPHRLQTPTSQNEGPSEQGMRERLLASLQNTHQLPNYQHRPETEPPQNPHNHNIDPAIANSTMMTPQSGGEGSGDADGASPRGKRELSQSKRAAQNRAAQRAFRQRKETHIKSLETQVREYETLSASYKALQSENYALREYIISLQGDLLQNKGNFPPPPAHIDLRAHRTGAGGPPGSPSQHEEGPSDDQGRPLGQAPTAPMQNLEQQLQASAAQGLAHPTDSSDAAQHSIKRQRTAEPSDPPHGLPTRPPS